MLAAFFRYVPAQADLNIKKIFFSENAIAFHSLRDIPERNRASEKRGGL
jgi:hypothetical protein